MVVLTLSMIARSVPEIHCTRGDPDFRDEEELGILVVGVILRISV